MEARLFEEGTVPEYTTADWYIDREVAPHVDDAIHRGRLEIAAAPSNVDGARARGVDVRYGDVVLGFDAITWADLAVMTEMLEHLVDPHGFLRAVGEHVDRIVVSSPYTETLQDHYGYHTWAWDVAGYVELMEQAGFESVRVQTWSMFQVHYGIKK